MSHELIEYKPLTEALTYSGDKYYKSCTPEEFTNLRASNESLYFDISKRYIASAHIKEWGEASPEDTMLEYETMKLTKAQKEALAHGIAKYKEVNPYKIITRNMLLIMMERIKEGKQPYQGPSN